MYRQGDVLIVACDPEVLEGADKRSRENDRVVLAHGEVTGHAHAIHERHVTQFYKEGDELTMSGGSLLKIENAPAFLKHEEHSTIELPPGTYRVIRQREYDCLEGVRRVAD